MEAMRLLVNAIELTQAAADMNKAMDVYNDAIKAVKEAAADLASKWEGDTQQAFVRNQDEAYKWYSSIELVVRPTSVAMGAPSFVCVAAVISVAAEDAYSTSSPSAVTLNVTDVVGWRPVRVKLVASAGRRSVVVPDWPVSP